MDKAVSTAYDGAVKSLLVLAAQAHHWHLATKSYAAHKALEALYETAHECADALSEAAQGNGWTPETSSLEVKMKFDAPDHAAGHVEKVCMVLGYLDKALKDEPWLANIVQECKGDLYKILYQLKRLS